MSPFRRFSSNGGSRFVRDAPSGVSAVYVLRGDRVESVHHVAACSASSRGTLFEAIGNIDVPIFIRSCAKPFIAAAIVRAGAVERFGFTPAEVAVIAGSHNGELHHVLAVQSILAKAGVPERALRCGAHPPRDEDSAAALRAQGAPFSEVHNNCSGKHAGLLALSRLLSADLDGYCEPWHPAQRCVLELYGRLFGKDAGELDLAIDGCGVPVIAISLRALATVYARLATLEHLDDADAASFEHVRNCMVAFPHYVGGTNHFDTLLMRAMEGTLLAKRGAEGVQAAASLRSDRGFAVKVLDGAPRALPATVLAMLDRSGALDNLSDREIAKLAPFYVRNHAGTIVGRITVALPPSPDAR